MAAGGKKRIAVTPKKDAKVAAVLVLLNFQNNSIHIPLIKRPVYEGVHSGQMAFPGGKAEKFDKDIIDTALRETREEIGIQLPSRQIIGKMTSLFIPPSNVIVTPVLGTFARPLEYNIDPEEVAEVVEIGIDELQHPANLQMREITVMNKYKLDAPAYIVQGRTIWGATAMILSELLHIVREMD